MSEKAMFQVSTLQALSLGYTKKVITVGELLTHGSVGLGTFEDVNGEMIVLDGHCYQAGYDGSIAEADQSMGVPFAVVTECSAERSFSLDAIKNIDSLKTMLDLKIEEDFGLNSMHIVRIDGEFERVRARSESSFRSQHVELKEILSGRQKDFEFDGIRGTIVALYFPDYMDGINAAGWHFHFLSEDRTKGGHVFDLSIRSGTVSFGKVSRIEIQFPKEAAFDTYDMKKSSAADIKAIEQGKK